jgi:hypothetical protein
LAGDQNVFRASVALADTDVVAVVVVVVASVVVEVDVAEVPE